MLLAVTDVTNKTMQEFPLFLYGKEISNNTIQFDEFMSLSDNRENVNIKLIMVALLKI